MQIITPLATVEEASTAGDLYNALGQVAAKPFYIWSSEDCANKTDCFKCRIPDDYIDSKRYPLFMARAVLQELIESLQSTRGVKSC